jgi:hypothetical protein
MSVVANVAINVDAANAIAQLNRVKTATGGAQTALATATKGAQGFGAALGAALGPILGITTALSAVGKAMNVFQERQTDIAVLSNGLTGLVANVEDVTAGLQQMADEFGKVTLFSEEDFMEGAQMLTSFRDIAVSSYQDVINTAGDVAQVMGTDVNSSLLQLAKALQDPVAGLTALSRSGIQFSESQKETIKSMVDAGNAAGAQALILGELKAQYGGAAAAAGSAGFAGAMDTLAEVTNDAFEILGKALDPVLTAGLNLLSQGVQTLSDWWSYLGSEVLPKVVQAVQPVIDALKRAFEGIDFDIIRVAIQNVVIQGLEVAIGVISNFSQAIAFVIDAFKALSQNPVFQFIADQVGRLANHLGLTNDKVGEFKQKQQEAGEAQKDAVANAVNLTAETEDAVASAEKLKEEHKKVAEAIKEATQAADADAKALDAIASQQQAITAAYYQAEKQINDVLLEQAQRQLDNAQNQAQRVKAAKEIYDLTVKQAELEYAATTAQIAAEVEKADLALLAAQQKVKEVEAIVHLASAQGKANEEHYKALSAVKEAAELADIQAGTVAEVATQQERAAKAVRDGSVEAAKAAYQQNIVAKATQVASGSSGTFASNMERAAVAAEKTATAAAAVAQSQARGGVQMTSTSNIALQEKIKQARAGVMRGLGDPLQKFFAAGIAGLKVEGEYTREKRAQQYYRDVEELKKLGISYSTIPPDWVRGTQAYQEATFGGMAKYGVGAGAGMGTPQVNITTGPVTQMDGTNYVTMNDLQRATSSAAQQGANLALSQLQNNPSVRRSVGVAR